MAGAEASGLATTTGAAACSRASCPHASCPPGPSRAAGRARARRLRLREPARPPRTARPSQWHDTRRRPPMPTAPLTSPRARAPRRPRARHERDGRRAGLGRPAGAALAMVGLGAVRGAALHQARGVRGDERCRLRMRAPRACIGVHVMCMWHETQCSKIGPFTSVVHIAFYVCFNHMFETSVVVPPPRAHGDGASGMSPRRSSDDD